MPDSIDHLADCDGNGFLECLDCGGSGGYHDCGEDCCACLEPEDDRPCSTCDGKGGWNCPACEIFVCPGCYAVGGEPCAPDCIDDEIRNEREDDQSLSSDEDCEVDDA